ncbi:MAG: FAD-linked oxidase C-terminal domain-containing protein [Desulfobacterales bacterium]
MISDRIGRFLLATDGSIFQKMPAAVIYPRTTADVAAAVRFAGEQGLAVHCRGAGSGLCGSALGSGMVIDFTRHMHRLLDLDPAGKTFSCQPGYRFGELARDLEGSGLFFPPDPSSGEYATFGGMVGTNASGAYSVKYGNVVDYIVDAEIVLADGSRTTLSRVGRTPAERLALPWRALFDLYRQHVAAIEAAYPPVACNVAGYNLRGLVQDNRLQIQRLLAGSEGTLAVVTRLTFRLAPRPAHDSLVVAYFDDIVASARAVQQILPLGPAGIEVMDKSLLELAKAHAPALKAKLPQEIDNLLLVEFHGGTAQACRDQAREVQALLKRQNLSRRAYLALAAEEKQQFWAVRKAAVPILYKLKGTRKIVALVEDAAVPTDNLVPFFEGLYAILERHQVPFVLYGHIAKGLLHTRPLLNLKDPGDLNLLRVLADAVYDLVAGLNGTVSGEHGDGRLRSAYIQRRYPDIYPLFGQVKQILDPQRTLNPEIKTSADPSQMTHDLRYGRDYRLAYQPRLELQWPENFVDALELCHGCAKCTTITTATRMCPVYKFTRREIASPKAKANLLRGLISGVLPNRTLYEHAFQEVMDQCVGCGACYEECPSHVNIPKLALEARGHYVRRYGTTLGDNLVARVESAARATRKFSWALAPLMAVPLVRRMGEVLTGVAAERDFIAFAPNSLYERSAPLRGRGKLQVLYFSGCYAGYIRPEIGQAALRVLSALNFQVHLPPQSCCGLPLLSKGLIGAARAKVRENLEQWQTLLHAVDHVTVTCSSCGHCLQTEWPDLLPAPIFRMLGEKTVHISHLINERSRKRGRKLTLRPLEATVAYHMPCHLKVQPQAQSSLTLLDRIPGLRVIDLAGHCCGIAGSWGLLARHADLSRRIGTPMITKLAAARPRWGVTDCPTCRIQMEHYSQIPIRHPVELLDRVLQ